MTEVIESKCCSSCRKEFSIDQFIGQRNTNITKTCKKCREINKIQDSKRDKQHRNEVARKNEAKPERKAVKAKWNEENYDKVAKKWMDYRQRKIETEGIEQYLKSNAEYAKKWRENNPEKQEIVNENKKNSKNLQYNVYSRNATLKNLDFTIKYDDYLNIVEHNCYYCGTLQEKGFNGIDRKDQTKGYILQNCVSCCKLCNYMKGSTSDDVFIKRAEHILTFQNKITGNLYPECFANHISASYSSYKSRAIKRNLEILITNDEYNDIIMNNCYLCGKTNNDIHTNGIDRIDNSKGYSIDNVKSCCGECNFMKKDYEIYDIIDKLLLIYENHKNVFFEDETEIIESTNDILLLDSNKSSILETSINNFVNSNTENNKHIVVNKNKKTKEQMREANRLYKQKQREKLKENYGDEEYKKLRANEIAELRKNKTT